MRDPALDRHGVIVSCPSCGRANRLRFGALGKITRCGHCHAPVMPPGVPIEVPDAAIFAAMTADSALPILVDFWAPWCGPCRMVAPELATVAQANAGRYLVVKVNTDVVTDVAARFRIRSIPTLALISGGAEIDRITGVRPARDIEAFAARALSDSKRQAS